ncbi:MAG: alpha/beta fold hydrolase [Anaerolineales bacterium]|nr:alpha/beta fold hydrolase [Anaerolineales bacterium]
MEAPREPLTERELGILARMANGLSDQQIAGELFLSLNTVKWHNRHIYAKLGVRNRLQAVVQARQLGLVDTDAAPPFRSQRQPPAASPPYPEQRVYFTRSFDGTRIAFGVAGAGPPLVKAANYMSHLERDWSSPVWRHWLDELTRGYTLIHSDERGCGLSDREVADVSFEAWVRDLEAVVDAVGLSRFPLFAMSQACPVAVAYAARHPERVSRLILHGGYARGWLKRDLTEEQRDEENLMIELMRIGWGRENPAFRQVFAMQLFPEATTEELRALETQMRLSLPPENAVRLEREMHLVDVVGLARQVTAPTLILHSRADAAVPFQEGRLLASLIRGAQFVALESKNHLVTGQEPAWVRLTEAMHRFLSQADR